ncbi:MAG: CHAT domain-containing protein [Isosphaeraceae bacterium]
MAEAGAGSLFDRFTDRARNVIVLAREEAVRLNHDYIGPEHLLLGIVREGEGIGASALLSLGIGVHLDSVRAQVALISVLGREPSPAYIPFSPSMRAVLEESWRTVLQLGHNYVGTEHQLLALLHDEIVVQLLGRLGADREQVREQVLTIINGYMTSAPTVARPPSASTASVSPAIPAPNTEPAGRRQRVGYADLDLAIRGTGPGSLAVRVLNSPAGQTTETRFSLPWKERELEATLVKIASRSRMGGQINSPHAAAVKAFGARLYRALFKGQIEAILLRSQSEATARGLGLRIRLRLTEAPEVAALPWEFLYDAVRNRFLCLSERTPLVRFLDVPDPIRPPNISRPLKVLVVISSPVDLERLDVEQEWQRISTALAPLIRENVVEIHRLPQGTVASLRRALRQDCWHILHFVGHGGFDSSIRDGLLAFEDDQRRSRLVPGEDLGVILHDHESLRLVALNACEGARTDGRDPFAGSAQGLLRQGIPAVVAMQFKISDKAALTLATEMYGAISDGYSLEASVAAARKAIFTDGNQTEWATPVIYLRTDDGMIFNVQQRR